MGSSRPLVLRGIIGGLLVWYPGPVLQLPHRKDLQLASGLNKKKWGLRSRGTNSFLQKTLLCLVGGLLPVVSESSFPFFKMIHKLWLKIPQMFFFALIIIFSLEQRLMMGGLCCCLSFLFFAQLL